MSIICEIFGHFVFSPKVSSSELKWYLWFNGRNADFFFLVLFSVILCTFHWRNQHRYIALIFNVLYFIYREMIHGGFIWILCIAFWVSDGPWNIFRASSFILAGIILIFNFYFSDGTLTCIFCSEMGNVDEGENSKFGWTMEIIRKYWAPAWQ